MELSSICKFFTSIILIGSVIACKEDNDKSNVALGIQEEAQKEVIAPPEYQNELPECPELTASSQRMSVNSIQEFDNGSDGDFYLASGEVGFLEDREYNFNNIYLESNSTIKISEQANTDSAFIKIHALGSCDLNGDVIIDGYKGTLEIDCDGQFNPGGVLSVSGSSVELFSNGIVVTKTETHSGEEGDAGSGAIISNGDDLDGDGLIDSGLPGIVDLIGLDDYEFPDITIIESPPVITVIEFDSEDSYACTMKP